MLLSTFIRANSLSLCLSLSLVHTQHSTARLKWLRLITAFGFSWTQPGGFQKGDCALPLLPGDEWFFDSTWQPSCLLFHAETSRRLSFQHGRHVSGGYITWIFGFEEKRKLLLVLGRFNFVSF